MKDEPGTLLRTIDPIEHVRAHPDMYLPGGVDPRTLATRLAGDALLLGASNVGCTHAGDWWVVWADADWLLAKGDDVREVFNHVLPFPEAGVNAMRTEVLLSAFAEDVLTITFAGPGARVEVLKSQADQANTVDQLHASLAPVGRPLWYGLRAYRAVAFRVPVPNDQDRRTIE